MNPVLSVDCVSRRFGEKRVLHSASLHAHAASLTVLVGRNGCGKTTMLRIVTGFIRQDAGHVEFLGKRRSPPRLHRMAAEGLFFLPDRDLLARARPVGVHFDALMRRFKVSNARDVIDEMRIGELLDRPRERLSGGERRRAELALAMARNPRCLIADEPFLGLAPVDAEIIGHGLRSMAARGAAVVVTGHEVETLFALADHVVWMTSGTTHQLGQPEAARDHDQFRREYLGPARRTIVAARV